MTTAEKQQWNMDKIVSELAHVKKALRQLDDSIREIIVPTKRDNEITPEKNHVRVHHKRSLHKHRHRQYSHSSDDYDRKYYRRRKDNDVRFKATSRRPTAKVPFIPFYSSVDDSTVFQSTITSIDYDQGSREILSREDAMRKENRNNGMLGVLRGTLLKFQQDGIKLKAMEDKKAEVEARVEQALVKQTNDIRKEIYQLSQLRKQRLAQDKVFKDFCKPKKIKKSEKKESKAIKKYSKRITRKICSSLCKLLEMF